MTRQDLVKALRCCSSNPYPDERVSLTTQLEQVKQELDALKRRCEAAEKALEGERDVCANAAECAKYPCYCIEGSAWKLKDLCAGNGGAE